MLADTTFGAHLVAVLQHDAGGAAVLDEDPRDRRVRADLDAGLARGGRDRAARWRRCRRAAKPHERNAPSISPM